MYTPPTEDQVRLLLDNVCAVCKPLLWLKDTDSAFPLAPALCKPLAQALTAIIGYDHALIALEHKLNAIYERAIDEKCPLVGIGAQPRSSRLGSKTAQEGLLTAVAFARSHREEFKARTRDVCRLNAEKISWPKLFDLTRELIKYLDWGEFVLENARGQAASLVLETVELSNAIGRKECSQVINDEIGDVFFNLMAFCLCMRIFPEHLSELTRVASEPSNDASYQYQ